MKTLQLAIIVISLIALVSGHHMVFAQNSYPNSPTLPEGSNPPAIITQVELASPFALFPDNQTCYNKPGFASAYTCSTDIIPNHKVQCGYFIGSKTCEPIHQYTRGTDKNCLGSQDSGISNAPQWFDVYNTQNKTIQLQYFDVRILSTSGPGYSEDGPHYTIPDIGPHEKCTIFFPPIDEPISIDPTNKTILISYDYEGKHYVSSTPLMTDLDNDNQTWQWDGNKWTFTQNETTPNFRFAIGTPMKLSLDLPLQQFRSGIKAVDVKCKSDFLLVIKSKDNHPACTTPLTALHLLEIGWGHIVSPFDTNVDLLNSKISGGTITGYHYDFQSKSLVIKTQTTDDGRITVTIPRKLLDAKAGNQDDHFYVLMNGQEIDFTETRTTDADRTLLIPFKQNTTLIEIIGAQVV